MSKAKAGLRKTEAVKRKISASLQGLDIREWKKYKSSKDRIYRNCLEMKLWRKAIFERDNFTCQKCGQHGGDLNAHHIFNFSDYPEMRFAIDNGITFCRDCHLDFHYLYDDRNNTREQLIDFINN